MQEKKEISVKNLDTDYQLYVNSFHYFQSFDKENQCNSAAQEEYLKFKNKLKVLNDISTIEEAKLMVRKMFNLKNEISYIKAGIGYCTIIDRAKFLQIVLKTEKEFLTYSFTYKKEKINE